MSVWTDSDERDMSLANPCPLFQTTFLKESGKKDFDKHWRILNLYFTA
jgi:hypothetical protein